MANKNPNNKTINIAGEQIDAQEFDKRALAYIGAFADYLGLNDLEYDAFVKEVSDKRNNPPTTFDPNNNADNYIKGILGTMKNSTTTKSATKTSSNWDKSILAKHILESIFGEDNPLSPEQLKLWANKYDKANNGVRSTEGRKTYLQKLLDTYLDRINNGEFDLSDEDYQKETDRISKLKEALTNNDAFEINKAAPWISSLLFTDEDYYATPELKLAAEQKALQEKAETYIKNGGENPYNKETQSELWLAAEEARKAQLELNQLDEFDNYSIRSSNLLGEHWLPKYTMIKDGNVFNGWDYNGQYGWQHMLDALYRVNSDYSKDGSGYDLYTGALGLGGTTNTFFNSETLSNEDTAHDGQKLTGIIPDLYMRTYDEPNDFFGNTTKGSSATRSGNAYKGKFISDYLNYHINANGDKYRISPDSTSFVLPDMVDWNKGTAYLITLKMNLKGSIKQVNIADLLPDIKNNNPTLYQELLQSYKKAKSYKKGGIIKAQFGTTLGNGDVEKIEELKNQINSMGQEKFNRLNLENQKLSDVGFSDTDWMRIGAAAADLTSAISAWIPGYGTAVAGVTGVGSTATNMIADFKDPTVSTGQAFTNLGVNLGLDLFSLIPGLGTVGDISKVTKSIVKIAPKLLAAGALVGNGPEFASSLKKLTSGEKMTVGDLKNLAYGLSAISGASRIGAQSVKTRKYQNKLKPEGNGEFTVSYKHKGTVKNDVTLSADDIKQVNMQTSKDNALKVFREKVAAKAGIDKPEEIEFAGKENFGKKLKFLNRDLVGKEGTKPNSKALNQKLEWILEVTNARSKAKTKLGQYFVTHAKHDNEIFGDIPTLKGALIFHPRFSDNGEVQASRVRIILDNLPKAVHDMKKPDVKTAQNIDKTKTDITKTKQSKLDAEASVALAKSKTPEEVAQHDTLVLQMERQLARLEQIKKNYGKGKRVTTPNKILKAIDALKQRILAEKNEYKDVKKALSILAKMEKLAEIGKTQLEGYNKTLADLEMLARQETYDHYRDLVRKIYGLKQGGILKASLGTHVPEIPEENNNKTSSSTTPSTTSTTPSTTTTNPITTNTGTLGTTNPETNTGTLGSNPLTNTGTLGNTNPNPNNVTYNKNDRVNPYSWKDKTPEDKMLDYLRSLQNGVAYATNLSILNRLLSKVPYHEIARPYIYKEHTSKAIEDSIANLTAQYNNMGAQAAAGTSDSNQGFAYKLTSADKLALQLHPYRWSQALYTLGQEDKHFEASEKTADAQLDVANKNHLADVQDYNQKQDALALFDSHTGNLKVRDIALRAKNLAKSAQTDWYRRMQFNQYQRQYSRLLNKKNSGGDWDESDQYALEQLYDKMQLFSEPNQYGFPYARPSTVYHVDKPSFYYWNLNE